MKHKVIFNRSMRRLYLQIFLVYITFGLLVYFSYRYVSNIEREQLHRSANNALNYTVLCIEADLRELETTLSVISETIRGMIIAEADEADVRLYLEEITGHLNDNGSDRYINGAYGYFMCFDGKLLTPAEWRLPEGFDPTERIWYIKAAQARGRVVMCDPYIDGVTGVAVISFSRQLFADDGTPLAIIALDIDLERVSLYAIQQDFATDAYGILFDGNLKIIAHPAPPYLGRSVYELNDGDAIAAEVLAGKGFLSERPAVSYTGEPSALFYKMLDNGWYLSMIAPYRQYYKSTHDMAYTLSAMGFVFATLLSMILISLSAAKNRADDYNSLMFQALPLPCILRNSNGLIEECNQEALELFKSLTKQYLLDNYDKLSPEIQPDGRHSSKAAAAFAETAVKEGHCSFEWLYQSFDGDYIPCEVTLVSIPHKKKNITISYIRDLREYKAYFAEIEKAQHNLRIARDAAEAANQAKSIFLANMSHEIRTPLNSIIGFSELAMDDNISAKTKDYLEKILDNGGWLLEIINDILDITKIESGKMTINKVVFNPHDVISQCEATFALRAHKKGITFYCHTEPSISNKLLGDPVRLRQALSNLLSNAVKFTDSGTIKFLVSEISGDNKQVTLRFVVKDTGVGIEPARLSGIFEPFVQADDSITRKYGGTGLGLTITHNIVSLMGGKLNVDSKQGVGTKFSFDVTFEVPDKLSAKLRVKNIEMPSYTGNVLICEDNIMNRQVICGHLTKIGITVSVAVNGKEGVDIVEKRLRNGEEPFDLIFMDINMPVMDGMEAATQITKLGVGTPIVAMTANIMPEYLEEYKKHHMNEYLRKPFTSQDLWKCLSKFFDPKDSDNIKRTEEWEKDNKEWEIAKKVGKRRLDCGKKCN